MEVARNAPNSNRRAWLAVIYDRLCRKKWADMSRANELFDANYYAVKRDSEVIRREFLCPIPMLPYHVVHIFVYRQAEETYDQVLQERSGSAKARLHPCILHPVAFMLCLVAGRRTEGQREW